MARIDFRPRSARRAGTRPAFLACTPAAPTANTTNTTYIPTPVRKAFVERVAIHSSAVPADADGTLLFNLIKYDASADADVTLVSSQDLETLVTTAKKAFQCTLVSTLSAQQRTLDEGDTLRVTIVSNSAAINTNLADTGVTVEVLVIE